MYKEHYGFKRLPFGKDITGDDMFHYKDFAVFAKRMDFLKRHGGIAVIWGRSGMGKSAGLRWFRDDLNNNQFRFHYFPNPPMTLASLYRDMAIALGLNPAFRHSDAFRQIQEHVTEMVEERKVIPIFAFDEMQLAPHPVLEGLRLFLNFEMDAAERAILILAGQPEFRKRLRRSVYEPLIHRTLVQHSFRGLERSEVETYLLHRQTKAGVRHGLFEKGCFPYIHQVTKGNMRLINHLVLHALERAAEAGKKSVGKKDIEAVVEEGT